LKNVTSEKTYLLLERNSFNVEKEDTVNYPAL